MQDFFAIPRPSLALFCEGRGLSAVHSKDLFRLAYKALSASPWQDDRFPKRLREACSENLRLPELKAREAHESAYDQSVKFLVELEDGALVETVLMPEKRRLTLCLSSQVGCAQGCVFCHTGRMGLKRHLSTGEIVGQVLLANRWIAGRPEWLTAARLPDGLRVTNIVFMGMGEPLDNVDAVADAIEILTDPYGLALGLRRISVSTSGHLDGIERLAQRLPGARLALSVHSVDDAKRSKIMPINKRWPLAIVIARLRELYGATSPIMFQYTMIKGVNDSEAEAERFADLVSGLDAKINLIPLNHVGASRLVAPEPERIQAFRDVLHARGLRVMVRYSKGQDIAAACGQLVV